MLGMFSLCTQEACLHLPQLLNPEHNPGQFLVSLKLSKCSIPESGRYYKDGREARVICLE